ncbi:MAG: hypothetical protein HC802_00045 [Caldilineaceae bacterium]|nr:hypothetical protein [Caldilineaceae bacterium]
MQLVERSGDLVLEMVNYRGPSKRFWELRWPGAFFKGWPFCAFYLEVADRSEFTTGQAFGQRIGAGRIVQHLDEPRTYAADGQRSYRVAYSRDERELGIEVDLMEWRLLRRWTQAGEVGWPMLESPFARQEVDGEVELEGATVQCTCGPVWLAKSPTGDCWIAGYLGLQPATMHLTTPDGSASVELNGPDVVVMENGVIRSVAE